MRDPTPTLALIRWRAIGVTAWVAWSGAQGIRASRGRDRALHGLVPARCIARLAAVPRAASVQGAALAAVFAAATGITWILVLARSRNRRRAALQNRRSGRSG